MSKSVVKKAISRGIQTKQYEQVTITVESEEEIEWTELEDRQKKVDKMGELLMTDFISTYNDVCTKLGVERCIGVVEVVDHSAAAKQDSGDDFFED